MAKKDFIDYLVNAYTVKVSMRSIYEVWPVSDVKSDTFELLIVSDAIPGYVFSFKKNQHITSTNDNYEQVVINRELGLDYNLDIDIQIKITVHSRLNSAIGFAEFMNQLDSMVTVKDIDDHGYFVVVHI